jgi:ABC-type multidrug transport system ATPase subunit
MDEADRCDRVALMERGRILAIDVPGAMGERFPASLFSVRGSDRYAVIQTLRSFPHAKSVFPFGDELHYADQRSDADAEVVADEVRAFLVRKGLTDVRVAPIRPGIEDTFMALMGAPEPAAKI